MKLELAKHLLSELKEKNIHLVKCKKTIYEYNNEIKTFKKLNRDLRCYVHTLEGLQYNSNGKSKTINLTTPLITSIGKELEKIIEDNTFFDDKLTGVNFTNGYLDRDLIFDNNSMIRSNQSIGFDYDPDAKCPVFDDFFYQAVSKDDADKILTFMGKSLFGIKSKTILIGNPENLPTANYIIDMVREIFVIGPSGYAHCLQAWNHISHFDPELISNKKINAINFVTPKIQKNKKIKGLGEVCNLMFSTDDDLKHFSDIIKIKTNELNYNSNPEYLKKCKELMLLEKSGIINRVIAAYLEYKNSTFSATDIVKLIKEGSPITYKTLRGLKVGGRDRYSSYSADELIDEIGDDNYQKIKSKIKKEADPKSAAKWVLRGLPIDLAIKKVNLDVDYICPNKSLDYIVYTG